jgi:predicted CopG family antitoxin
MATKTITIDVEAYDRLKLARQKNESLSQTIVRVVPKPISVEELILVFRETGPHMSKSFFRGVEAAFAARNLRADKKRINVARWNERDSGSPPSRRSAKTGRRDTSVELIAFSQQRISSSDR